MRLGSYRGGYVHLFKKKHGAIHFRPCLENPTLHCIYWQLRFTFGIRDPSSLGHGFIIRQSAWSWFCCPPSRTYTLPSQVRDWREWMKACRGQKEGQMWMLKTAQHLGEMGIFVPFIL